VTDNSLAGGATQGVLKWHTSSFCNGGACVRVASQGANVLVGDSKDPDGAVLTYSRQEFGAFIEGIRRGDFDNLS